MMYECTRVRVYVTLQNLNEGGRRSPRSHIEGGVRSQTELGSEEAGEINCQFTIGNSQSVIAN